MSGSVRSRWRYGCFALVAASAVVVFALALAGVASWQNRRAVFDRRELEQKVPQTFREQGVVRVRLTASTATVSVTPIAAGKPIRIDADYDPREYVLEHGTEKDGADSVVHIDLRPAGSAAWALLRVKLGGRPANLEIGLPRDVPFEFHGRIARGFAAVELGGLTVDVAGFVARESGLKVSFAEPLARPMETFSAWSGHGALSVVRLGNASPRESRIRHAVGAVDLDLRGAWSRDGEIEIEGHLAGGSVWLPRGVEIEGLDVGGPLRLDTTSEIARPRLAISVTEKIGRFFVFGGGEAD